MGLLKDVIYLSKEDYETLVRTGTVTIGGETLTYDENNLYLTPETQNVKSVNSVTPDANGNVSIPVGTGTVTEVTAGTGLTITSEPTETPQVEIASGYKLPSTTEWNSLVTSVDSINPVSGNVSLSAVRYVSQTLNDTQKTQARSNIGAAASSHAHGNITSDGKITSTAVSSASGVLVYDSSNIIQRASGANARSIIGAAAGSVDTTNKTVTIDGNTLTFHNNAFTDTAIPVTYIQSASKSNDGNTLTLTPIINGSSSTAITFTPTFTEQHIGDVVTVDKAADSHLDVNPTSGNVIIGVANGYSIPSDSDQATWSAKGTYSKPAGGIPGSDLAENYVPFDANNNVQLSKSIYLTTVGSSVNTEGNSRLVFGTPSTIYSYLVSNQSGAFALAKDSSHGFLFYPGGTYSCLMPNFPADLGRNDTNGSYAWRNIYMTGSIYHHTGNNSFVQLSLPTTAGTLALKSEIPTDHNQTVKSNSVEFGADVAVDIVGSGAVTVIGNASNNTITISAPAEAHIGDVVTVSAEDGLEITGTTANPVVGVDSTHKLPTTSEWSAIQPPTIDDAVSTSSTNPVQNKAIADYIASRGENLLTNGTAFLGNNYNFTALDFDGSDTYYGDGCFKKMAWGAYATYSNDEFIPVDVNNTYRFDFYTKTNHSGAQVNGYIRAYDIDKNEIGSYQVAPRANTLTTLAQDLKNGDTKIYLTDMSGWQNTSLASNNASVLIYGYKNSFGYEYPPETYTRYRWTSLWSNASQMDYENNCITLNSAWNKGNFTAGTPIAQGQDGSGALYCNIDDVGITCTLKTDTDPSTQAMNGWEHHWYHINGLQAKNNFATSQFPYGTAYVKIGLMNRISLSSTEYFKISTMSFTTSAASVDQVKIPTTTTAYNYDYPILFKNHKNTDTEVSNTSFATTLTYNPNTKALKINGSTIPSADTNQKVKAGSVTFDANDVVNFEGSGIVSVTGDATNDKITISASHQSIKTLKTDNTAAQSTSSSETIAGTGTINLHKVSKTGTYSDLIGTPTLGTAAAKDWVDAVEDGNMNLVTSNAVYDAIDALPEPMVFKGTLGTGGTITTLPAAAAGNEGYTYKVITAGTYASQTAKVGDVFVCVETSTNTYEWVIIPAGDTDSDTWREIKVNGTSLLGNAISTGAVNFKNGTNITVTGSGNDITISTTVSDTNQKIKAKNNGTDVTFGNNDVVEIVAGSNITVSADSSTKTITINGTANDNDNQTIKGNGTAFGANDVIDIIGGGATTVTADTTNKKITISTPSVTDHNQTVKGNGTAFGADDAVDIVGSGIVSVSADTTNKKITITGTEAHVGDVVSVGAEDGLENSGTATAPIIGVDSDHKLLTNTEWGDRMHYCDTLASVGGNGNSGSYLSVRWYASGIDGITTPYNGMRIWVKVPLAGVSTAGVVLSINGNNNADYYPVVYNVNTVLTSHFPVNSYKCLVFTTGNPNTVKGYLTSNTATNYTSYWHADANYDTNTTMTYGTLAYYFRPYVKEAVYRYKLVMLDQDNRLVPLSKTNLAETVYADYASSTSYAKDVIVHRSGKWYKSLAASNKGHTPESSASWWSEVAPSTPTSSAFRPDKIYWYNTTTTISAGGLIGGNTLMDIGYNQPYMAYCNFNEGMLAYRMIYLCGTYDTTTGLFTLRDGGTAGSKLYYTTAPTNTGSITLSSYFTDGYDYILVGGTYSSNNYLHLRDDHPMYHFDGTNLVPYDTWYTRSYIQSLVYTGSYN